MIQKSTYIRQRLHRVGMTLSLVAVAGGQAVLSPIALALESPSELDLEPRSASREPAAATVALAANEEAIEATAIETVIETVIEQVAPAQVVPAQVVPAQTQPMPSRSSALAEPLQLAQTATPTPVVSGLSEQPRLINACRFSPEQGLEIFEDAARTRRIRTLTAPTQGVILTGIVGTGLAQIKDPVLGWIGTAVVEPCTTPTPTPTPAPTPTPTPTPAPAPTPAPTPTPSAQACYQVVSPQLTVRTTPNLGAPALGVYASGALVAATTNPPREQSTPDGRIWVEVKAPNGTGWMSRTGPNATGENAVRVTDRSACES
ncbi:MAG: hypothetical protein MUF72_09055 [Elainella sp. Prado103]|jgi:hypothetical protein|nr:hypothetical protein [Elainella sp. Prado103]